MRETVAIVKKRSITLRESVFIVAVVAMTFFVVPHPAAAGVDEVWMDGPVQPGGDPQVPDVAVDRWGRSVVVWRAFSNSGGDNHDIWLRRFDADGNALMDPVMVNTTIDNGQNHPRVAVSGDGSFLVVWQSSEDLGGVLRPMVRSQAFDANANPVGTEQLLSTLEPALPQDIDADVAALRGGGYAVVWKSDNTSGTDTNDSIQARRVAANGVAQGGQFQVNSTVGAGETDPAVTELSNGGFLVLWAGPELHGRRFSANGAPVGDDFQINTSTDGSEAEPDATIGWDNQILVVWKDTEGPGDDREIMARVFSETLAPQGDDFFINTIIDGVQDNPRASQWGPGGFFVAWESSGSVGNDSSGRSIQGRIVRAEDHFAGPQFQINAWIEGDQQSPGVGGGFFGSVGVVWKSQSNSATSDNVITGRMTDWCDIFCDDFEEGDFIRWSSTQP